MNNQNLVELNTEIERIDNRVAHIEQIASTVEEIAGKGFDAWTEHLRHKQESQERELELENKKHERELDLENIVHKRAIIAISAIGFCVFILVASAMFLGYTELVKTILTSSFAIGAGFGLRGAFLKNKR